MRFKLVSLAIGFLLLLGGGLYLVWKGVPLLIGSAVRLVPPSWEERLGSAVMARYGKADECGDQQTEAAVNAIAVRLQQALPPTPYKFQIKVVRNPEVNAMAAPGGHIVIFSGLLNKMGSAEELAAVLAHEMQHVIQRHSTHGIVRAVGLQLLIGMVLGDAGGMADLAGNLSTLHFARSDEWSADEGALENLMRAGIAPSAMAAAFGHLAEASPDGSAGRTPGVLAYLSTHPPLEERIQRANERQAQWQGERRGLGITLRRSCEAAK